jgi:MFS family permease
MSSGLRPYLQLVTQNKNFRWLWLSQIVSNFGDWFGLLALYALIQRYSDSEFLLGLIIVVKMLSLALFSPIAGYLTDRYNRRQIMIICDLSRGVIVLGLLLIRSVELLWLAYFLTAVQMMISALFEPAKTSSIPNITTSDELVQANILSAASWSIIFTTGMAIGGFATGLFGTDVVFILNSISYLISGWFIWKAIVPQETTGKSDFESPWSGMKEGFRFLFSQKHVLRPAIAKGTYTIGSGALVYMLILVAEDVLLMGSIGLGLLYASRGIGTGIGPVIGRRLFQNEESWIMVMGLAMIIAGFFYLLVGFTTHIMWMLLFVLIAHAASGANWVMSTVLLQRRVPDQFRGRVFSSEWLLFTLTQSISVMAAAWMLDRDWVDLTTAIRSYGILMMALGTVWLAVIVPWEVRERAQFST